MASCSSSVQSPADPSRISLRTSAIHAVGMMLLVAVVWADVERPFGRAWSILYLLPTFYAAWFVRGFGAWILTGSTALAVYLAPVCFRFETLYSANHNFNRILGIVTGLIVVYQAQRRHRDAILLERANEDLERRVAERTGELQATNASLEAQIAERRKAEEEQRRLEQQLQQSQKMEAMGQLAGGIAHDFNNILTVILCHGEIALQVVPAGGALHDSLQSIVHAGEQAAALTRQLLAFSRRSLLAPKVLLLNDAIRNSERMLQRLIGEDIQLLVHLDPAICWVKVDPRLLEQVLVNLVINARDAMPPGGCIEIETSTLILSPADCGPAGAVAGRYGVLSVSDTGCGMTADVKARIFEPFFTTKSIGKGSGLGLSVVEGIIKQSGGWIDVRSRPGEGTIFRLNFPAVDAPPEPSTPAGPPSNLAGTETILIVEDEESVGKLASIVLQSHGYRVLVAGNGLEAAQVAENSCTGIDLLLTDVVMPQMGGRELVQILRPRFPQMKVIYMSGYTDDAILRRGLDHDTTPFQQKPFTPAVLATKVRTVLDGAI
jgi:signal transduction histidine kinase